MTPAYFPTLVVIDMQERLLAAYGERAKPLIDSVILAIEGAKILGLPIVVTEQYPKGLGHTIPEILSILPPKIKPIEKTAFSCFGEPAFIKAIPKNQDDMMCVVGIETHVCVQQTVFDALDRNFRVDLLADATLSRKHSDMERALTLLLSEGAGVTTVEAFLFDVLRDAADPHFKAISKLVR